MVSIEELEKLRLNETRKTVRKKIEKQLQQLLLKEKGFNIKVLNHLLNDVPFFREGLEKEPYTPKIKKEVIKRDNERCQICYNFERLTVHHIDPQGSASMDNLITLCSTCHSTVHKMLRLKGYKYYQAYYR
ncbi:MAG: HNH endonuclease [Candidatus Heimdallarchaeaceae archaeon]